ncbi:DUF4160 domain-containing protein [uncultured Adlercreutzia sp.]|uniref:DUF4160 domain-containing protein n=1 Tax=uncultured Adlercreutzia sp. TaxID=875803 RepID=UPI00266B796E|nr:DUF4160 domain-containing protein [uncultured Adlercreutzia sp.]
MAKELRDLLYAASVDVETIDASFGGALPARQLKIILAWNEIHRDELMQNWELARDNMPLNSIDPL